ncbi:hypothetical protein DFA_08299 [Cavenderia fasciculata]|uniref:Uncharacterized protein n=1 Tax=Cavenderia fasciculata TaxID=261658 RepID=F4Q5P7_CACFS|nr:uncharacterized protein DFA_08299 [Cavenderia fasciculata]EGG17306.1 hypothetical protein DFA_08299 [Cavenderia fasciculata]|eukprot:XP_004355790.1 hypothetical protein DFA_08299 [Cavenderia fasciculata]
MIHCQLKTTGVTSSKTPTTSRSTAKHSPSHNYRVI